jgi:hypothetical protein
MVFLGAEIPPMEVKLLEVIRGTKFECYPGEEVMGTANRKYTACA